MPGPDSTLTLLLCAAFASGSPSPVLASPGFNHLQASLSHLPDILCILSFLCALQDSRPLQPPPVWTQPIQTTLFSLTSSLPVPSALLSPSAAQCQHPPHHIWDVLSSPHSSLLFFISISTPDPDSIRILFMKIAYVFETSHVHTKVNPCLSLIFHSS